MPRACHRTHKAGSGGWRAPCVPGSFRTGRFAPSGRSSISCTLRRVCTEPPSRANITCRGISQYVYPLLCHVEQPILTWGPADGLGRRGHDIRVPCALEAAPSDPTCTNRVDYEGSLIRRCRDHRDNSSCPLFYILLPQIGSKCLRHYCLAIVRNPCCVFYCCTLARNLCLRPDFVI